MVFPISKSATNHIERLMKNFLWYAETTRSRRNYSRWQVVCLPTEEGGLGIRCIQAKNEASFLKLGWLAASSHSLWVDWMSRSYFPRTVVWSSITPKFGSRIWRMIRKSANLIHSGCRWIIGKDSLADIWFDSWAEDICLAFLFPSFSFPHNQRRSSPRHGGIWIIPFDIPAEPVEFIRIAA